MIRRWQLESGLVSDIVKSKKLYEDLVEFHWRYYSELAFQRRGIREELNSSLRSVAAAFQFSGWQRVVKYKYSLDPLSAKASLFDPGGRFNVGAIDPNRYPMFPALYLAADKGTALAEVIGRDKSVGALTPEQLALTKPDSISAVSVSGKLEAVVDIRMPRNLSKFVSLIKDFKLSKPLISEARRLGWSPLTLITTVTELRTVLMLDNWRNWPTLYDVPAGGQVFGGAAATAGIEGILYESVLTGRECLAVFPQNFLNSSSYVELDDPAPRDDVRTRIDSGNFAEFI
jgi:RES domain